MKSNKFSYLAFDRSTVRSIDEDGRLHVSLCNISKATVNPYYGYEIPDSKELGLDDETVYQLLRHPEELEKAAATFNNLPLLNSHVPVSAEDHQPGIVVGSTGTDAQFNAPYLQNSLVVWAKDAIENIENEEQKELSCAYRYEADMTPGTYDSMNYDGIMRNIRGNHVALVAAGRAGPDVVVGDSQLEEKGMKKKPLSRLAIMAKGALSVALKPKLAADAKLDLNAILTGVNGSNWAKKKPAILAAIKPKLATDADLNDIHTLLDSLDKEDELADAVDEETCDEEPEESYDEHPHEKLLNFLKDKISEEDLKAVGDMLVGEEVEEGEAMDEEEDDEPGAKMPEKKGEGAMDAKLKAIEQKTIARMRGIIEAEKAVRPYVGEVVAQDSAEAVYKIALDMMGIKTDGIHPSAFRAILEAQPKPNAAKEDRISMDSAQTASFTERFPGFGKLKIMG